MQGNEHHDALLTTAEVAAKLRRSPETLSRWRRLRQKGPPYIRMQGGRVLYDPKAVDRWLQDQVVQAGAK